MGMTESELTAHLVQQQDHVAVWQAQGILMEVHACGADEAAEMIRRRSVINGRRPVETADTIVSTGGLLAG